MNAGGELRSGADRFGLALTGEAEAGLLAYLALMAKWNRTYNLTGVRDQETMVSRHLLDSLAVLPRLDGIASLADLGSGAGLPGIPLAIVRPDLRVTLIESSQKKASFLQQAKISLKLENVSIHCGRSEAFKPDSLFDAVIARALSDLAGFVRQGGHLLAPGGRLLAMKAALAQEEIDRLPAGWRLVELAPLAVPGAAARHLAIIEKA